MRNYQAYSRSLLTPEQEPGAVEQMQQNEQVIPPTPEERFAVLIDQLPKDTQGYARSIMNSLPEQEERAIDYAKSDARREIWRANTPRSRWEVEAEKSGISREIALPQTTMEAEEKAQANLQARFSMKKPPRPDPVGNINDFIENVFGQRTYSSQDPRSESWIGSATRETSRRIVESEADSIYQKIKLPEEPRRKVPDAELPADIEPGIEGVARQALHDHMEEPLTRLEEVVARPVVRSLGRLAYRTAGAEAPAGAFQSKQDRDRAVSIALGDVRSAMYAKSIASPAVKQFLASQGLLPDFDASARNRLRDQLIKESKTRLETHLSAAIEDTVATQIQKEIPKEKPRQQSRQQYQQAPPKNTRRKRDPVAHEVEQQITAMQSAGKSEKQIKSMLLHKYHPDVSDGDYSAHIRYVTARFDKRVNSK